MGQTIWREPGVFPILRMREQVNVGQGTSSGVGENTIE